MGICKQIENINIRCIYSKSIINIYVDNNYGKEGIDLLYNNSVIQPLLTY